MKGIRILLSASACCAAVAFGSSSKARIEAEAMDAELVEASHQLPEESAVRIGDEAQQQDWKRGLSSIFSSSMFGKFKTGTVQIGGDTCTYEPDSFESYLVAEFIGSPELLTDEDLKLLEDAFVESYDEIANTLCDREFRKIESSEFSRSELEDTSNRYRALQGVEAQLGSTDGKPRRFSLKIFVLGNCKRCPKEAELFDDAFRRLGETAIHDTLKTGGTIYRQRPMDRRPIDNPSDNKLVWSQSEFNCDCIEEATFPSRPPGLEEFNSSYERKIKKLAKDGSLKNVQKALGVAQVKQVPCDGNEESFKSEVLVEAEGDPEMVSEEELDIMKDLFIKSYSTAIEEVCDSLFRVVVGAEVTVETMGGRRLPSSTDAAISSYISALDTSGRFRPFRFRFKVSGKCKGCEVNERLFDDAFRRVLNEESPHPHFMNAFHRDLGYVYNGNECFCVTQAPDRAPYEEDFGFVLNFNVAEASLPNIQNIGSVIQVDDTMPSASPSMAPTTSSPSDAPSRYPTSSPTPFPTLSPSITESESPSTFYPSAEPSPSPSNPTVPTESPMPSPQPSLSPTNSN